MSTNLTVSCISDVDGRKIIDIEQFWRDLGITEDSIQENNHLLADKLLSALDSILDDYVQYHSTELIGYINDMLEKCHQGRSEEDEDKKWYPLLSETSNIAVELDRKAISWQRVQQSQEKV